jgi:exonuclease III
VDDKIWKNCKCTNADIFVWFDVSCTISSGVLYQSKKFDKPVHSLKSVIKSHKLIDIWRHKKKTKPQFTWNRKDKSEATRIDYFLVSSEILMNSYSCDIRPIVLKFTGHNSISLKLKLFKGNKGKWILETKHKYSRKPRIL